MKLKRINHDKLKLLIFFCGFYTDENTFLEFDRGDFDILFVYDYSSLDFSPFADFDFTPYTEINLIAYSYGVFAANIATPFLPRIDLAAAAAGTIFPIDENYGIKPKIFDLMLNSFDENVLSNFKNKMELFSNGEIKAASRTIENLRAELFCIKEYSKTHKIKPLLDFGRVIITKKDRIIPYLAQKNFWTGHTNAVEIDCGHFPFFYSDGFDGILGF